MDHNKEKEDVVEITVTADAISKMARTANMVLDVDDKYISATTMMAIVNAGKFMLEHMKFSCTMVIAGDASVVINDMLRLGFRHVNGYFEPMYN